MISSWLDLVPPEALRFLEYAAWLALLSGFFLWLMGVAIARAIVALLLGGAGALICSLLVSHFGIDLAPATATILGFIIGLLIGVLCFKFLQALTLAVALGLAVSGLYYTWHVRSAPETTATTAPQPSELKVQVDRFDSAPSQAQGADGVKNANIQDKAQAHLLTIARRVVNRIGSIPVNHQRRMIIAGLGSLAVGLLIALGFPRMTTAAITAILGTLMMVVSASLLWGIYRPGTVGVMPTKASTWYAVCAVIAAIGLIIQYSFFIRKADKGPKQVADAAQASEK